MREEKMTRWAKNSHSRNAVSQAESRNASSFLTHSSAFSGRPSWSRITVMGACGLFHATWILAVALQLLNH
jgi:hypothetical protein